MKQSLNRKAIILFLLGIANYSNNTKSSSGKQLLKFIITFFILKYIFRIFGHSVSMSLINSKTFVLYGFNAMSMTQSVILGAIFAALMVILLYGILAYLQFYAFKYEKKDEGLEYEYGILTKKYKTLPLSQITNVEIERSILERILGISTLHIQTAGNNSKDAEGIIPGLEENLCIELKNWIASSKKQ